MNKTDIAKRVCSRIFDVCMQLGAAIDNEDMRAVPVHKAVLRELVDMHDMVAKKPLREELPLKQALIDRMLSNYVVYYKTDDYIDEQHVVLVQAVSREKAAYAAACLEYNKLETGDANGACELLHNPDYVQDYNYNCDDVYCIEDGDCILMRAVYDFEVY